MKIPKKLKICGLDYKVIFKDDLHQKEGFAGLHRPVEQIIELEKNYHPQTVERNFLHEIVHAINNNYCNGELTENQVNSLANGLYQVLNDNKLLK